MNRETAREIARDASHPHWIDACLELLDQLELPQDHYHVQKDSLWSNGKHRARVLEVWGGKVFFVIDEAADTNQTIGRFLSNYKPI
jgi:hypothetical protein